MYYLALAAVIGALGLVSGLIYAAYRWGRKAQQVDANEAIIKADREIHDTLDKLTPVDVDRDWMRHGSNSPSTNQPSVSPPTAGGQPGSSN